MSISLTPDFTPLDGFDIFPPVVRALRSAVDWWDEVQNLDIKLPPREVIYAQQTLLRTIERHHSFPPGRWGAFSSLLASLPALTKAVSVLQEGLPQDAQDWFLLEEVAELLQSVAPTELQLLVQEHFEQVIQALGNSHQASTGYEEVLTHFAPLSEARDGVFESAGASSLRAYLSLFERLRMPGPAFSDEGRNVLEPVWHAAEQETTLLHGRLLLLECIGTEVSP